MSLPISKSIFISYSDDDKEIAVSLREALRELLGNDVWMKDFELDGGDLIVEAVHEAIEEAKWFILLLSSSAVKSPWIKTEANLATIRAIESLDIKILIVRLDETPLPKHLVFALNNQFTIDLSGLDSYQEEFIRIAEYIDKNSTTRSTIGVYVDRGESRDEFSLTARRNKIVFILGWAGIGKTSFVIESVAELLKKRPIVVRLTRGHSLDLLCRQVLQKSRVLQPINSVEVTDNQLLLMAIDALKQREDRYFLFLDNAEEGLDGSNQLLTYLDKFLEEYLKANIATHIVLATTRIVDYPAAISKSTDILRLSGLDDKYIKESLDQWLQGTDRHEQLMKMPELDKLVSLVSGHPLAAKMLASFLKVRTAEQLLSETERHRFELKLAQYILRSADHSILSDIHRLILQILATVREPMLLEDMLAVKELKKYSLEQIHTARWELSNLFLIEQNGELMSIHNFLVAYYKDQLVEKEKLRDSITHDVGLYAYKKATDINADLKYVMAEDDLENNQEEIIQLSGNVFRYAIPAARLLRAIGKDELADELPLQINGTLREMVFYFYQEKKDYKKALEYAEKWLKVNPNDNEIMLQRARCYRNFRNPESLIKADQILSELGRQNSSKYFAARLYREKALVAEYTGQPDVAKNFFREGIRIDTTFPYIENYVGLSMLLLEEAEKLPFDSSRRRELAEEALSYLEIARNNQLPIFDRFHLGTYVEALIESGQEDKAFPLLMEALQDRPEDERLNYRMAEILRKQESYELAERYAREANRHNHRKAPLSLANIFFGQAQAMLANGENTAGMEKLQNALDILSTFRPEYGDDQEVADTIAAKVYRTMGRMKEAKKMIVKYEQTNNPYTIYEQCKTDLSEALLESAEERHGLALNLVQKVMDRIRAYESQHDLPQQLSELLMDAELTKMQLENMI